MSKKEHKKISDTAKTISKKYKIIKATQVRQNFQEVVDSVHYTQEALVVSKHGKPWVLIEPLDSDTNTLELLDEIKGKK